MIKKISLYFVLVLTLVTLIACRDDEPKDPTVVPTEPTEVIDLFDINPQNDIYYQLFVRSFADSNDDGIGDLNGITENLDYLESLGITALWLLPINPSPSYHGYNITDYYDIESDYGTLADFENLINEAENRNIKIVIDLVINHTSDQHPWYTSARQGSSSPYRDYYIWNNGVAFESFVGGMKDLNFNNEAVKQEVKDIMDFYLEMGVHGFRIDAAKHLLEGGNVSINNSLLLHEFNTHIKANYPNSFIVSEVFDYYYQMLSDYYIGSDSVFNFYMASNVWDKIGNGNTRYLFSSNLKKAYDDYRFINPDFVDSPFIGNHDLDRIASMQGFNGVNSLEKLKLAASVLLTLPGSPFIYYGDELGMKGVRYEGTNIPGYGVVYDEYRRQPLKWGNQFIETTWLPSDGTNNETESIMEQQANEHSLLRFYQEMIQLRKSNPALMFGNYFEEYKDNSSNIQGYIRYYEHEDIKQAVLVIHNFSLTAQTLDIPYLELLFNDLTLEPFETVIMTIDPLLIGDYI
ncbi:MAG: alpha-amylase family glycosyl hydrolase [Acholeplasmataceae bacterium]|jgi:glycosidase|nr:alpha-amylase family glycosyl hydrolase [Acholeplasmataceae bacterium]